MTLDESIRTEDFNEKRFYYNGKWTTLGPKSCKIFLIMYGIADTEGNVNTSLKDLSDRSGISVTTIRRAIQELRNADILDVSHVG
ncbi:helix-turn-helix domain-containing protein [Sporolactobacillus laevolacticus]|uniref:helix-turn-helix domain-containing protein n=1 Tax=Sporolactobacillus laevolacticus TaxID=33018 RepID=UPI00338E2BEA